MSTCVCRLCKTTFQRAPSRIADGRGIYCSKACWIADMPARRKGQKGVARYGADNPNWRGRRARKLCPECGIEFAATTATCSQVCGRIRRSRTITGANNPFARLHPAIVRECILCGTDFTGPNRFWCSGECYTKGRTKSPRALWLRRRLLDLGYAVELEKSWPWLHRPGVVQRMRVDLWLPRLNTAIEYDGRHHHDPTAFGATPERWERIRECDSWKDRLLAEHSVRLLRVSDWPIDLDPVVTFLSS